MAMLGRGNIGSSTSKVSNNALKQGSGKTGPAASIPEHPGAFLERGVFGVTEGKTYMVRVGSKGSYGDHIFSTRVEAEAYARSLASKGESVIRQSSALPLMPQHGGMSNPVDAARIYEVPHGTPYVQGIVGPQVDAGTGMLYRGGGPQVVLDKNVLRTSGEIPIRRP